MGQDGRIHPVSFVGLSAGSELALKDSPRGEICLLSQILAQETHALASDHRQAAAKPSAHRLLAHIALPRARLNSVPGDWRLSNVATSRANATIRSNLSL